MRVVQGCVCLQTFRIYARPEPAPHGTSERAQSESCYRSGGMVNVLAVGAYVHVHLRFLECASVSVCVCAPVPRRCRGHAIRRRRLLCANRALPAA